MEIAPQYTKRHINVKPLRHHFRFVQRTYPGVALADLCREAGLPIDYFDDSENWVSVEFLCRLHSVMVRDTGNNHLSFDVGKGAGTKEALGGPLYVLVKYCASIRTFYEGVPRFVERLNKVTHFEVVKSSPGRILFELSRSLMLSTPRIINGYDNALTSI